jgi:hypothetical protein
MIASVLLADRAHDARGWAAAACRTAGRGVPECGGPRRGNVVGDVPRDRAAQQAREADPRTCQNAHPLDLAA